MLFQVLALVVIIAEYAVGFEAFALYKCGECSALRCKKFMWPSYLSMVGSKLFVLGEP